MSDKEEIAALRKRIDELERANKPPEPFKPAPYQRYDPTANFSLPPSVVREMAAAVPANFMRDIVRDNRAPMTPATIPASQQASQRPGAGDGTGWSRSIPLSPPPGVAQADRLMDAQDARDRAELIEREAKFKGDGDTGRANRDHEEADRSPGQTRGEKAMRTFQDQINKQTRKEIEAFESDPLAKRQQIIDRLWQDKLDAEAPFDDGYDYIGGFREKRTKYGFHKHWRDPDF
jgi:hypothetical protein